MATDRGQWLALAAWNAPALERALLLWQERVPGPARDPLVIADGKTPRRVARASNWSAPKQCI